MAVRYVSRCLLYESHANSDIQIKNCVRISHALAVDRNEALAYVHLTSALNANEDFDSEHRNVGLSANAVNSYL